MADGFVDPLLVVVRNESSEGSLQLLGALVVLESHQFPHRAVLALDLALRHRVMPPPSRVPEAGFLEVRRQST